jgi:hypothetical protein
MLQAHLRGSRPIRFDWENKWLRGDQYAHMLHNIENYSDVFGMQMLAEKEHPQNIYIQPESKFTRSHILYRWPSVFCAS